MSKMMEDAIADGRVEILDASLAPVELVFTVYARTKSFC